MPKRFLDIETIKFLEHLASSVKKSHFGELQGGNWSSRPGPGLDFLDYRSYTPGDDIRRVDWNLYVRLGKPFVKLFHQEEDVDIHLVLDVSASMGTGSPSKISLASQLVAALGYVALQGQERAGLWTVHDGDCRGIRAGKGNSQIHLFFDFLTSVRAEGCTDLSRSLEKLIHLTPRGGVYIVLSDYLDLNGWERGIGRLLSRPYSEVLMFHIADVLEDTPNWSEEVELVDPETLEVLTIMPDAKTLKDYESRWKSHKESVETFCRKQGIAHIFLRTDAPVDKTMLLFLRNRGFINM